MDDIESLLLRFFVTPGGDLSCRVTEVYTRRTWILNSARDVYARLREGATETATSRESPTNPSFD